MIFTEVFSNETQGLLRTKESYLLGSHLVVKLKKYLGYGTKLHLIVRLQS